MGTKTIKDEYGFNVVIHELDERVKDQKSFIFKNLDFNVPIGEMG